MLDASITTNRFLISTRMEKADILGILIIIDFRRLTSTLKVRVGCLMNLRQEHRIKMCL